MPEINTPLGRRNLAMSGAAPAPQQRVLTVPDEEMEQEQALPRQDLNAIQETRKQRIQADKRISPSAKERTEILAGLGRVVKEVEYEGIKFTLRSLKAGETKEIFKAASQADTSDSLFEARNQTLARAIYLIDGQPIDLVLGSEDSVGEMLQLIEEMDENTVEHLHNEYLGMLKKNREKFAIKDEADAQEVAENIKK